jgi:hypothetical protein
MDPGRRAVGGSPERRLVDVVREASCEEIRAMLTGFVAYFGTFDIDESSRTVIHHVHASLVPTWVGADLRRTYELAGDSELILTATSEQGITRLVWQRES